MNRIHPLGIGLGAILALVVIAAAWVLFQPASGRLFGQASGSDIDAQIHDYLMRNPDVIVEAMKSLDERRRTAESDELKTIIAARHKQLLEDPAAPVAGNPKGSATLVEFFDYNCPYCRKASPIVDKAIEADRDLRVVFKEFPILGPGSIYAARAALAANRQGKYLPFHRALMASTGSVGEAQVLAAAKRAGLDTERLKRDVEDKEIAEAVERNLALAQDLRISGTPSFIIGDQLIPGLISLQAMQKSIEAARQGHDRPPDAPSSGAGQ